MGNEWEDPETYRKGSIAFAGILQAIATLASTWKSKKIKNHEKRIERLEKTINEILKVVKDVGEAMRNERAARKVSDKTGEELIETLMKGRDEFFRLVDDQAKEMNRHLEGLAAASTKREIANSELNKAYEAMIEHQRLIIEKYKQQTSDAPEKTSKKSNPKSRKSGKQEKAIVTKKRSRL